MAGRPKMTEAEKFAAKAAREAAKAGASDAADRAQARSDNGKPAEKAAPAAPAAAAAPRVNSDDLDREEKALFLNHHLPAVRKARAAVAKATADLRNAYKKAKAEGNFAKADFDMAFAVETAEAEARERAKIARALRIAKIMGSSLGNQLDMFLEPDRTPAADRAYEEGQRCSIENRQAKPPYDPSTEQFRRFMEGFHEHQATLAKGIKPTNEAVKEDVKATAADKAKNDQQRAVDEQTFDKPVGESDKPKPETVKEEPKSGTPMTRAQFKASQEAAKAEAAK